MTIQLSIDLIDFFSDIKIKFEWSNKFYIDFMDYFPLLKQGKTTKDTYYMVIAAYGLVNNFIDTEGIINTNQSDLVIIKIYNSYIKYSKIYKILYRNFPDELLLTISPINNNSLLETNKIVNNNVSDELKAELDLANSLLTTISSISESLLDYISSYSTPNENSSNCLLKLINIYSPKSTYNKVLDKSFMFSLKTSKIFNKALETPSIRLLSNILNDDTEDMALALYIDEINFYVGHMDLYLLAISRKNIKIANMLKEFIIIQNFYVKQALIIGFECLIGPSDIPNIIYDIIK